MMNFNFSRVEVVNIYFLETESRAVAKLNLLRIVPMVKGKMTYLMMLRLPASLVIAYVRSEFACISASAGNQKGSCNLVPD